VEPLRDNIKRAIPSQVDTLVSKGVTTIPQGNTSKSYRWKQMLSYKKIKWEENENIYKEFKQESHTL